MAELGDNNGFKLKYYFELNYVNKCDLFNSLQY
jgi:hypothetical protein